jgi:hypothetical protein
MKILHILSLALVTIALAGCAVTPVNQEQMAKVRQDAQEVFGDSSQFVLMPIASKGEQADAMVLQTRTVTGHPSVPAEQLAQWFSQASTRPLCIAVTGVSSRFAAAITTEALSLSAQRDLQGLRLLFVGEEADKLTVQQAVEARGGTFYFRPQ